MKTPRVPKVTSTLQPLFKSPKDILNFYRLNLPVVILLILLSIVAYANGLNGQFLSADDENVIIRNQQLRDFGHVVGTLNLVFINDSALINVFGMTPVPFHLLVLTLHIVNSCLVLLLAYILLGKRYALYAALLFSVLPTGSEALFWISGSSYIYQAFFTLLCVNAFFVYRELRDRRFLLLSAAIYAASFVLMQNPWMLTTPFIIVSLDLFKNGFPNTKGRGRIKELLMSGLSKYGVYILASILFWAVWIGGQFSTRVTGLANDYYSDSSRPTDLLTRLPYTVFKTLELYIFPLRLSFFHEEALSSLSYNIMIAVTVVFFLWLAYLVYKRSRFIGLVLATFATILPTFSPVQIAWFTAERYLYLGGAFFAMILSLVIIKSSIKFKMNNLAPAALGILLVLYSLRVIIRANDFKTSKALWTATQKTAPISYRVYNNLGDVYSREQNWPAAIQSFEMAIKVSPNYTDAIHNLGYTYMLMGDYENAKKYLLESYQKNNNLYQALEKLGQIELAQGNKQKAKEYFDGVRIINPNLQGLPNL